MSSGRPVSRYLNRLGSSRARPFSIQTMHVRLFDRLVLATAPSDDRHGRCLLHSIAPTGQGWHQSAYRLTDALSEIWIRPSRSSHCETSNVRSLT
jgi:hypothetical protein